MLSYWLIELRRTSIPVPASAPTYYAGAFTAAGRSIKIRDVNAAPKWKIKEDAERICQILAQVDTLPDGFCWAALEHGFVEPHEGQAARAQNLSNRLRPEVLAFAWSMEQQLREHDDERSKTYWQTASPNRNERGLLDAVTELVRVVRVGTLDSIARHATHVGNCAMMIADCTGELDSTQAGGAL